MLLTVIYIKAVQIRQPLFEVKDFLIMCQLFLIDLIFEQSDLSVQLLSLSGVAFNQIMNLALQSADLFVFDFDDCTQSRQLTLELLVLVVEIIFEFA